MVSPNPLSWFSSAEPAHTSTNVLSTKVPSSDAPPAAENPSPELPIAPPTAPAPAAAPIRSRTTRVLRQLLLPGLGASFLLLSLRLTRRSLQRRFKSTVPPFYHPNNAPPLVPPNGAFDAAEALQLATMNVVSVAMLLVGGGAFALDVSSVEELRTRFKQSAAGKEWGEEEKKAEEEWEEWIADVLARKEIKERVKREVAEGKRI